MASGFSHFLSLFATPNFSLSLSLSLPTYSPFNVFHSPTTNSIFISLLTLNQALFSYQFETLKLPAFSLPTSHQTAPDHTLEHFLTPMFDTMNSSYIKMVDCKYPPPPPPQKKKSKRIVACNLRVFLSTYFSKTTKIALQVSFLGSSKSIPHKAFYWIVMSVREKLSTLF